MGCCPSLGLGKDQEEEDTPAPLQSDDTTREVAVTGDNSQYSICIECRVPEGDVKQRLGSFQGQSLSSVGSRGALWTGSRQMPVKATLRLKKSVPHCWNTSDSQHSQHCKLLEKLEIKCSAQPEDFIGLPTSMLSEIIDHAILKKARAVATDHPLSTFFHVLPSRRRYRCIKCKTSHYSFVPVAIRMLNAK